MEIKITPAQAEAALDAIEKLNLKHVSTSKAAYAFAKNTLAFNRVLKDFDKFRAETRREFFADGEKFDPSSEKAAAFTAKVHPVATTEVEVNLHKVKLSDLMAAWTDAPLTVLTAIDFFIEDDLSVDAGPATT